MSQQKSFFGTLFDISFSSFVTIRIVGILYGIIVVLAALVSFAILSASFQMGFFPGIGGLLTAAILFLFYILIARMVLEGVIAAIKTAENTGKMLEIMQRDNHSLR